MPATLPFETDSPWRQNLAKNRHAVANGFHHQNGKFSGSPGSGLPLRIVNRKFEELVFEQEIPETDRVQLMHNCLSGIVAYIPQR